MPLPSTSADVYDFIDRFTTLIGENKIDSNK